MGSLGQEEPLEKEMATHSSILAGKILWTEQSDRLQSMWSRKSQTWLSDLTAITVFMYLFLAALALCCFIWAFSSCSEQRLFFVVVSGLLIAVASLVWSTGSSAGSVVLAQGLSCPMAYGIFPDQGSNLCPLHWPGDSYPFHQQGSPHDFLNDGCVIIVHFYAK